MKSQSVNKSKKIQLRNLPAKKEKEHCGRQIPTDKYNKNTTLMFFFSFKVKQVMETMHFFYL